MLLRAVAVVALVLAPVAARAADDDNPFKRAKVGDYAKYSVVVKNPRGEQKSARTQTVTATGDKELALKSVDFIDGKEVPNRKPDQKIDLTKPFDPVSAGEGSAGANLKWEKHKDGTEKLKVDGKEYECTWTTYKAAAPPTAACAGMTGSRYL